MGSIREGASRVAEQWPYLRYLGMGAWWAWIWLCYSSACLYGLRPDVPASGNVGMMYLSFTPAIAAMCVVAAAFQARSTALISSRAAVVALGAVASAGTLLVALSPWCGGAVAFAAGGVLTGIGTSALCLKTGAVLGTLGRREVLSAGAISLMFAGFLYFMGIGLPVFWRPEFVAVLPLVSALLYIMPGDDPFSADDQVGRRAPERAGKRVFWRLLAAVVMVAATAGFAKGIAAASGNALEFAEVGSVSTFLIFIGAAIACLLANYGDVIRTTRAFYAACIVYGICVVLLSGFGFDLGYIAVGKELLWMLFTCLMAYMVFRFDFSPVRAFGLGQAAYLATSALSWWLGMTAAGAFSPDAARMVVPSVMVVVIVVVFAFAFRPTDIRYILEWRQEGASGEAGAEGERAAGDAAAPGGLSGREPARPGDDAGAPSRELTLRERIERIPERFGVSAREREIIELFAGGRSANWIAEELVISKNTVRSHLRSIYTKLDVHTRQELLDFLNTVQ